MHLALHLQICRRILSARFAGWISRCLNNGSDAAHCAHEDSPAYAGLFYAEDTARRKLFAFPLKISYNEEYMT